MILHTEHDLAAEVEIPHTSAACESEISHLFYFTPLALLRERYM